MISPVSGVSIFCFLMGSGGLRPKRSECAALAAFFGCGRNEQKKKKKKTLLTKETERGPISGSLSHSPVYDNRIITDHPQYRFHLHTPFTIVHNSQLTRDLLLLHDLDIEFDQRSRDRETAQSKYTAIPSRDAS